MTKFSDFIKNIRLKNALTQTQFAAKLDIDTSALSKIENGKRYFPCDRLLKLCDLFNLDYNDVNSEYFSEKIAYEIFANNCSETILNLTKDKFEYLKNNQSNIRNQ
ncbi:MAG: helix-turn-helix domain-containing protein [Clostridiales Family XIII bacterium]|jgi:transcriptional regulator with XRE-family HTH domain|nr:helix-turn-helix domain-containing protein [Clostridiales Family XIII bacterium]